VCSGLGEYSDRPVLIRLAFAGNAGRRRGHLVYIVLAIVLPEADAPAVADQAA
jgi:phage shock protein PspC (stress-responsive transcriptional regulator)